MQADELAPAAPSDLAAIADGGETALITLSWTAPTADRDGGSLSGLASYIVFRAEGSASAFIAIDTVSAAQTQYSDASLSASTQYFYAVSAIDANGNISARSSAANVTTAGTAAPVSVQATTGINKIEVTWSASADDDLSGYNVYRSTQSDQGYERQTGVEGTTFTTGQTTYVDSGLTGGAIYFYRITVVTTAGESDQSAFAGATVSSDSSPPATPTFLDGDAVTDDPEQLNLTWRAPSEDEDGGELTGLSSYQIYRATSSSGTFELVGTSTEAAFTDTGLTAVTTYFYQVEALDADRNISLRSATLELTTSGVVVPSDVRLVSTTPSDAASPPVVTISWTASTGAILRYEVQRTTVANSTNDADYTDIVPNNSDTSRQDSTVTRGQTYYYRVRAEDVDSRFSDWTTPLAVTVSN